MPNYEEPEVKEKVGPLKNSASEFDIIGLRPLVWRLVLGALPNKPDQWIPALEQNYQTYEDFKKELIVKPKLKDEEEKKKIMDHPLSNSANSVWNTFFKDQELWDEIEKDVKRTRRELNFFCRTLDESKNTEENQE